LTSTTFSFEWHKGEVEPTEKECNYVSTVTTTYMVSSFSTFNLIQVREIDESTESKPTDNLAVEVYKHT
jgi:hypothetical protein